MVINVSIQLITVVFGDVVTEIFGVAPLLVTPTVAVAVHPLAGFVAVNV